MDGIKLHNQYKEIIDRVKKQDYLGTTAKEELTNNTTLEFYGVLDRIRSKVVMGTNREDEVKFLSSLAIVYEDRKNTSYYAYAMSSPNDFDLEHEEQNYVVFNAGEMFSNNRIIIHEIAHIIVDKYCCGAMLKNGWHCLEFAIITYCLDWHLNSYKKRYNSTFFRSYDIHEDIAYPNITINPCRFDSWIKSIEWNSIEELANKAKDLAKKIRDKTLS